MKQVMLMRLLAGLFILIIVISAPLQAQPASSPDLNTAEQLYRQRDYAGAVTAYENLLRQGYINGESYYNLGNCYYKMGRFGRAILNYERAGRYLGKDPDLKINLKLANLRLYDRIEPLPRVFVIKLIEWMGSWFSVRRWGSLFIVAEWLLLGCLIALHLLRDLKWRKLFIGGFVVLGISLIITGSFFTLEKTWHEGRVEAVILTEKVEVRSAPEAGSTELFTLHEGAKLRILREVTGWAEIRLADGKQGWLPMTAFEVI